MTDGQFIIVGYVVLLVGGFFVICLPIFIAFWREHPNRWAIMVLTVALGATLIGWLVAFVWSLHGVHRSKGEVANGGESGLNLFANDPAFVKLVPTIDYPEPTASNAPRSTARGIQWAADQLDAIGELRTRNALTESEHAQLKQHILKCA